MQEIFDFYELRIACHVKSVNYFAGLLGYHFPEHDSDKIKEPIRTGYAFVFYKTYHKNFCLSDDHEALCHDAKKTHHEHAPHHIEFYETVTDIPDIELYEMVSDWASANFEQQNILHEPGTESLSDWFEKNMAKLPWTKHQLEIINKSFETIIEKADKKELLNIWQDLNK